MRRERLTRALAMLLALGLAALGLAVLCHACHVCDNSVCCPVCQALRARRMLACIEGALMAVLAAQTAKRRFDPKGGEPRPAETLVTLCVQMRD